MQSIFSFPAIHLTLCLLLGTASKERYVNWKWNELSVMLLKMINFDGPHSALHYTNIVPVTVLVCCMVS